MNTQDIMITGTGSYIPENQITNAHFGQSTFFGVDGKVISDTTENLSRKLEKITGIRERRYAMSNQNTSDIAVLAAKKAIEDAGIDKETLGGIILANNFGDIAYGSSQIDLMPSLSSRVKHALKIENPNCTAFDIIFGCAGWVHGLILARQSILAGDSNRILVIGAETLSRTLDPFDRDSMIYADGAAAVIVEGSKGNGKNGIISSVSQTFTSREAYYLYYGKSNKNGHSPATRYIKMEGKKIYQFALTHVPAAMKACLDKAGISIDKLKKVFIHQANAKMDHAILNAFCALYGRSTPGDLMPMNIQLMGNSSVATVPTLLDLVLKNKLADHNLEKGDVILLASVGAGMNISAVTYVV